MPTSALVGISLILILDAIIVGTLLRMATTSLRECAEAFPPHPTLEGAPQRRFQSIAMGVVNLGACVHITLDGSFVHLHPSRFARWCGMRPMSLPVLAITPNRYDVAKVKAKRRGVVEVKVRSEAASRKQFELYLPTWVVGAVLQLQEPEPSTQSLP